jgi:peptide/nickel transport system permease protein
VIQFLGRRVIYSIVVLFLASIVAFVGTRIAFDPTARLAQARDPNARIAEAKRLGLDKPLVVQYGRWLGDFVQGDLGETEVSREPIAAKLRSGMWLTLQLLVWGVAVSVIAALIIGVYSAVRQYTIGDYVLTTFSFMGISIPPFWFAFIAIQFFVFTMPAWFGTSPWFYTFSGSLHSDGVSGFNLDYLRHLFLPVLVLTVQNIAGWSRYQRASMLDTLNADYVRTARAKGVPRRQVVLRHALRNAMIPVVTVMALDIGLLFGGLVITEQIFSIPGMGRIFVSALDRGDATMLTAWTVVAASFVLLFNLLADLAYGWLDPRVRIA